MLEVSQNWKNANLLPLRPEQNIRFVDGDGNYYEKECFSSFTYKQSGSIENKIIPSKEIICEVFKDAFDAQVNDYIVVYFGMMINGSYEWVLVNNFKITNREEKANTLTVKYEMTAGYSWGYTERLSPPYRKYTDDNFPTDIFELGSHYNLYYGNLTTLQLLNNELGIYPVGTTVPTRRLGKSLGKMPFGQARQYTALALGQSIFIQNLSSNLGYKYKAVNVLDQNLTFTIPQSVMYKQPEVETFVPVKKYILKVYTNSQSPDYDEYSQSIEPHSTVTIPFETGKYFNMEKTQGDSYMTCIFNSNTISLTNNGDTAQTITVKAYYMNSTFENFEFETGNEEGEVITIDNPLITKSTNPNSYFEKMKNYLIECAQFSQKYVLETRIDPCLEFFDKVGVEFQNGSLRTAVIESIEMTFNGAFNGKIHLRTGEEYQNNASQSFAIEYVSGSGSLQFTNTISGEVKYPVDIWYSYDLETWTKLNTASAISFTLTLNATKNKIYFRGTNNYFSTTGQWWHFSTTSTLKINVSGNIISLYDISMTNPYLPRANTGLAFTKLFINCTGLVSAENLELKPKYLSTGNASVYRSMFEGCTNLEKAPKFFAIDLAVYCYQEMFKNCSKLSISPILPTTDPVRSCYQSMFEGCIELTDLPVLDLGNDPLPDSCCKKMFYNCSKIKLSTTQTDGYLIPYTIKATTGSGSYVSALEDMFTNTGGTFTGTPVKNTTYYLWDKDYTPQCFYFELTNNQPASIKLSWGGDDTPSTYPDIEYSLNNGQTWTALAQGSSIALTTPHKRVYFRGNNTTFSQSTGNRCWCFYNESSSSTLKAGGDISSLYDKTMTNKTVPADYCFAYLFTDMTTLTDVSDLRLTPTTVTTGCYQYMLSGTGITSTPEIDAINYANNAFFTIFPSSYSGNVEYTLLGTTLPTNGFQSLFGINSAPNANMTIDCRNIVSVGSGALYSGAVNEYTLIFSNKLTSLPTSYYLQPISHAPTYNLRYELTDSDTPQFDVNNVVEQITSANKGTYIVNVYTDNTSIANAVILKRNEYTTVNVYHLDGTSWGL